MRTLKSLVQPSTKALKEYSSKTNYCLTINKLVLFSSIMQFINRKILKFLPRQLTTNLAKVAVTISLFVYWGLIIVGTFLQFN